MLHFAAQRGNRAIIEYICDSVLSFNINSRDIYGNTVIHYAVESKRASSIIPMLVTQGADIWARNLHGQTALHLAARLGRLSTVQALLAHGPTNLLRVKDIYGMTPIHTAAQHKADTVLSCLTAVQQPRDLVPENTDDETVASGIDLDGSDKIPALVTRSQDYALPSRFRNGDSRSTAADSMGWTRPLSKSSFGNPQAYWCIPVILTLALAVWSILSFVLESGSQLKLSRRGTETDGRSR